MLIRIDKCWFTYLAHLDDRDSTRRIFKKVKSTKEYIVFAFKYHDYHYMNKIYSIVNESNKCNDLGLPSNVSLDISNKFSFERKSDLPHKGAVTKYPNHLYLIQLLTFDHIYIYFKIKQFIFENKRNDNGCILSLVF